MIKTLLIISCLVLLSFLIGLYGTRSLTSPVAQKNPVNACFNPVPVASLSACFER